MAQQDTRAEWERQQELRQAEALAAFPFERLEVSGADALQEWERLKTAGRGAPVVVGNDEDLGFIAGGLYANSRGSSSGPDLAKILLASDQLIHPDDLRALRHAEEDEAEEWVRRWCEENPDSCGKDSTIYEDKKAGVTVSVITPGHFAREGYEEPEPPVGEWPAGPMSSERLPRLTIAQRYLVGPFYEKVHIVLVPTDDWTTIPAHLRWGGWNANPTPEYHVAALRSWRDRFGAELVGLGPASMNIRVARRPETRDQALALAREQYDYCNEIVDQGFQTFSNLGAALKSHDWWFFWWD